MSPWITLDRAVLMVSGADTFAFLDNLLTQDIHRLKNEPVVYAALLSPQGKIICDMFAWATNAPGDVILDVATSRAPELLRRLNMYKLRSQVTITDVTADWGVVAIQEHAAPLDPRFPKGRLGGRSLFPEYDLPRANQELYDQWRITVGVPDPAVDAEPEEVFALEALLEELNGVDFKKGCFVGQENVSRMKRRATTRKKFCPIVFDGPAPPRGAMVTAGAAELGTVRSGAPGRALALLRLDRALEAAEKGDALTVDGRPVKLAPPDWLILPKAGAQD